MRQLIPDPDDITHRPTVIGASGASGLIIIEIDGQPHRIRPDEARRIAKGLLQAASIADRSARGGGDGPGDDPPGLR